VRCTSLSLVNFRNYRRLDVAFDRLNVLVGDNGQGKSNIIEALHLLATTRSGRSNLERDVINWDSAGEAAFARLSARVDRAAGPVRLEMVIAESPRAENAAPVTSKRYRVDGVSRRAVDVIGQVKVVVFTPRDVELVAGPPAERRRYFDVLLAQIDPRYARAFARYARVVTQRNGLLRLIRERGARADQLAVWSQELVNTGSYLLYRRIVAARAITGLAREAHRRVVDDRETLSLGYQTTIGIQEHASSDLSDVAGAFARAIEKAHDREIQAGQSLVGPHRDELRLELNGRSAAAHASRGQQRAIALSLRIAEAAYIREQSLDWPILLLDDVMSELDARRRERVLVSIGDDQQVILTSTDREVLEPSFLARALVYDVRDATLLPSVS